MGKVTNSYNVSESFSISDPSNVQVPFYYAVLIPTFDSR